MDAEEIESLTKQYYTKFTRDLAERIREVEAFTIERDDFYGPSSEPLGWTEARTTLVRVDVAVMAIHITAARITFKVFPKFVRAILRKLGDIATTLAAGFAAKRLVGVLFGAKLLIFCGQLILAAWQDSLLQRKMERDIRDSVLDSMRQFRKQGLSRARRYKRKTKIVYTRHKSPKQREANELWRSPISTR